MAWHITKYYNGTQQLVCQQLSRLKNPGLLHKESPFKLTLEATISVSYSPLPCEVQTGYCMQTHLKLNSMFVVWLQDDENIPPA